MLPMLTPAYLLSNAFFLHKPLNARGIRRRGGAFLCGCFLLLYFLWWFRQGFADRPLFDLWCSNGQRPRGLRAFSRCLPGSHFLRPNNAENLSIIVKGETTGNKECLVSLVKDSLTMHAWDAASPYFSQPRSSRWDGHPHQLMQLKGI